MIRIEILKDTVHNSDKLKDSQLDKELQQHPGEISDSEFLTLLPVWLRMAGTK